MDPNPHDRREPTPYHEPILGPCSNSDGSGWAFYCRMVVAAIR